MKSLFGRGSKGPPPADPRIEEMNAHLEQLRAQIGQFEEALRQLSAKQPHITIEQVHIHHPKVEKMEYRLDKLDIEHLSGSLNLGNNFGAKASHSPSADPSHPAKPSTSNPPSADRASANDAPAPHSSDRSEPVLRRTATGYRLSRN